MPRFNKNKQKDGAILLKHEHAARVGNLGTTKNYKSKVMKAEAELPASRLSHNHQWCGGISRGSLQLILIE